MSEVTPERIARLLEEKLWCNFPDIDHIAASTSRGAPAAAPDGPAAPHPLQTHGDAGRGDRASLEYLEAAVFPTLVPGLHELLQRVQAYRDAQATADAQASRPGGGAGGVASAVRVSHGMPDYGPTGTAHPITWLADYLIRQNTAHTDRLWDHPYNAVTAARAAAPGR